jgi:protocatechuate 3,4-dioxygenase beta subunit
LFWAFIEVCSTLRAANAALQKGTTKNTNRPEKQANDETNYWGVTLTGNHGAYDDRGNPRAYKIAVHHAHSFIAHISSRIGPATMQAFRSRAIRRSGFMVNRIVTVGQNVK